MTLIERQIISALIRAPERVLDFQDAEFFSDEARRIFLAMRSLHADYGTFDLPSLAGQLNGMTSVLVEQIVEDSIPALLPEYQRRLREEKSLLVKAARDDRIRLLLEKAASRAQVEPDEAVAEVLEQLRVVDTDDSGDAFPIRRIADIEAKPVSYQVEGVWLESSVGFISGQPGTFKTWLAWELGVSISSGTKAFGRYPVRRGRVLAFNAEDDPARITRNRIAALAKARNLSIDDLDFSLIDVPAIRLDASEDQRRIQGTVRANKPEMIILDPIRNVHSRNEDSATEMTPIFDFLRRLQRDHGCSVLIVSHERKPSKETGGRRESMTRGTNALEGWRDNAIYLDRDKESGGVKVSLYHRGAPAPTPFLFRLHSRDEQGCLVSAHLEHMSEGQAVSEATSERKARIMAAIKTALVSAGIPQTKNQLCGLVEGRKKDILGVIDEMVRLRGDLAEKREGARTLYWFPVDGNHSQKDVREPLGNHS